MSAPLSCEEFDQVSDELALGTLSGVERGDAITHVASCARCRARVESLARAAEAMLLLAPEDDPPLGFESRVAEAVTAERPAVAVPLAGAAKAVGDGGRSWRQRRVLVAAAVAAAVVGGAIIGRAAAPGGAPGGVRSAVAVAEGGRATCHAVVIDGRPAQLMVTVDEPGEKGQTDYTVEAQSSAGHRTQMVGTLHTDDGHGAISAAVDDTGKIDAIRVFQSGQLRYEARF